MKKRIVLLVLVLVLISIVISIASFADADTGWPCASDATCEADLGNGLQYYCNTETTSCFQITEIANASAASAVTPALIPAATPSTTADSRISALEADVTVAQQDIKTLDNDIAGIRQSITSTTADITNIQRQLGRVSTDVSTLSQSLTAEVNPKVSQALAGQAALQQGLNQTQTEVALIEQGLQKEQAFSRFLKITFFVLLVIAAALGVLYYLNRGKENDAPITQEITSYITTLITKGRKLPAIKETLLKAGWMEEEILNAYQETIRRNYQHYQEKSAAKTAEVPAVPAYDKTKIASIAIVSIILIIGIVFLISGAVGKAFFITRFINQSSGEIIDVTTCTPPQIMSPEGTCCTDANNNSLCDVAEREVGAIAGEVCSDNLQCGSSGYCINGRCATLASLYQGSEDCDKLCNYYALRISTSDQETYTVRPGRGSYTAVGALEWRVGEMPQHCEGERAIVPIHIITKETGKVLSEEVIALQERETSTSLTHLNLPEVKFTLTIDDIFELCE